ncbi:MAG: 50S ribosomal protein L24 [Acidobacteria bacterium RBG_16_64_8]|nr:MAG: 50S ribosomal protein L24 [Acidobacteria bacterium RBG_16_64_8]
MVKTRIKRNDQVLVIAGRDRGAKGKVLRVFPSKGTAIVERVNMMKKHTRANPQRQVQGGILEREAPIRLSKLMVICPESAKPTRVGRRRLDDGKGVRVAKRSGATLS